MWHVEESRQPSSQAFGKTFPPPGESVHDRVVKEMPNATLVARGRAVLCWRPARRPRSAAGDGGSGRAAAPV